MAIVRGGGYEPMVGDPDDHRPSSAWRAFADPGEDDTGAADLALIMERCAVGDRIPLHRHDVDEAVTVLSGEASYRLGDTTRDVAAGDTVFIPAGVVHGTRNTGDVPLQIYAFFPAARVRMEMVDRNPAPGTESEPPRTVIYDFRTGDVEDLGPTTT